MFYLTFAAMDTEDPLPQCVPEYNSDVITKMATMSLRLPTGPRLFRLVLLLFVMLTAGCLVVPFFVDHVIDQSDYPASKQYTPLVQRMQMQLNERMTHMEQILSGLASSFDTHDHQNEAPDVPAVPEHALAPREVGDSVPGPSARREGCSGAELGSARLLGREVSS